MVTVVETSQELVSKIDKETRIGMLGRNWLSHDAQWQMAVVMAFGWETGNQLNLKVAKEMGKIMMLQYMKSTGISGVENIKELRDIILTVASSNWSSIFENNDAECQSATSILFKVKHCKTYSSMLQVNATDKYECGCFPLRSGFCDALNVEIVEEPKKSLMKGDDKCEIVLSVKNWQKREEEKNVVSVMETSQELVFKIDKETRIEMLIRNWLSHDARWQMAVVKSFGWDAGNRLTQQVTRNMGKTMMLRFMSSAGISRVENVEELREMLEAVISLNWSDASFRYQVECPPESAIRFKINRCETNDNISKANATDKYECGCFALRSGFCDALKLKISQECKTCLMKGDKKCEIILKVEKW